MPSTQVSQITYYGAIALSEELVPPSVYESLKAVAGLRRGHEGTKERPKVKPVPRRARRGPTLPHLIPQVAAMVRLQRLIGARATEVCWASSPTAGAGLSFIRLARTRPGTWIPAINDAGSGCRTSRGIPTGGCASAVLA